MHDLDATDVHADQKQHNVEQAFFQDIGVIDINDVEYSSIVRDNAAFVEAGDLSGVYQQELEHVLDMNEKFEKELIALQKKYTQ